MRNLLKGWPPREVRRLLALVFLAGGGISMTAFAAFKLTPLVAESGQDWAIAYALLSCLAIIALVMFFFGWSIVKAMMTLNAGAASFSASGGSGDGEEQAPPPIVTTTTTTAVQAAPVPATPADEAQALDEARAAAEAVDAEEPPPVRIPRGE